MSDMPCPPMFATETMAELSARQGRVADALAIYRYLVRGAEGEGEGAPSAAADDARVARWKTRLTELESGTPAAAAPSAPAPAARPSAAPAPAEPPRSAALVIRDPVRSGQVVYADAGRDLIVIAPVHPGSQLLADGNIHVYGPLKGRAVAGAQGNREAQVFCLCLEAELVGVDTGYVLSDDISPSLWSAPARVLLTPEGSCAVVALSSGRLDPRRR